MLLIFFHTLTHIFQIFFNKQYPIIENTGVLPLKFWGEILSLEFYANLID